MRVRHAFCAVPRGRTKRPVGVVVAVVLGLGIVQAVPAHAAPPANPAAAEEQEREAAMEKAPPADVPAGKVVPKVDTTEDQSASVPKSEFTVAFEKATATGKPVELASQTTETTISHVQPDGLVRVESAAGPVRMEVDGDWVDVDLTLKRTADGVRPVAVPGDIRFSPGGNGPMVVLGDGEQKSLSLEWAGRLPEPSLKEDTATYRDVFPGVDLVLTATRQGFQQRVVVKERPTQRTLAQLRRLQFALASRGARVAKGGGGELQVVDEAGAVVGTAAAPVMWDARTDHHTGDPVAVREIGLDLAGPSRAGTDATLVLSPPDDFLTDPSTVYPVTIDPTQSLGPLGDTFVQTGFTSAQGGATELRAGTYGGGSAARSYLRFDVGPVKNRVVQSANLSLYEFHSWSCNRTWVDIRDVGDFDPNWINWSRQPWIGGIASNAQVAYGYSSACPANWVDFNLTGWMQHRADSRNNMPNVMALGVFANEGDVYGWKKFNSANMGWGVPTLTFTYDGRCDQYAGQQVCGAIRDKYYSIGGAGSWMGLPLNSETAINGGAFNHFQNGSIYWSPSTGAHIIRGAIRDRWGQLGWENSFLGYPTTDEIGTPSRYGAYNHFTNGSIYWSPATGAWEVSGLMRDKWAATGWENGPLGFPTSTKNGMAEPNSFHQYFERDALMYLSAGAPAAYWISGPIRAKYASTDWQRGFLGFPTSDPTSMAGGTYNHFQGGSIFWSQPTGAQALRGPIRDKYAALGWANSSLGFPTTDQQVVTKTVETTTTAADGTQATATQQVATDGLVSEFTGGSIYWSANSGAHPLQGAFRDYWVEMGAASSWIGLPSSDQFSIPAGKRQEFLQGQLLLESGADSPRECTITGTSGSDHLIGTEGPDIICALDGDDIVEGLGGDDALSGDGGNDVLYLGPGLNGATGGPGSDRIEGGPDDDLLVGEDGNDTLIGGGGADGLFGMDGNDRLEGGEGDDHLTGAGGDDELLAGAGDDALDGGAGQDQLSGEDGADTLTGGDGADVLKGGLGGDRLAGQAGDDTLEGGDGSDSMSGGVGDNALTGGDGQDVLDPGPSGGLVDGGAEVDDCVSADAATSVDSCEAVQVNTAADTTGSYVTALAPGDSAIKLPQTVGTSFVGEGSVESQPVSVSAPTSSTDAVTYATPGGAVTPAFTMKVSLPVANGTAGTVATDGTVVYDDSSGQVDATVQMLDKGQIRLATVIQSATAPSTYDYGLSLPVGASAAVDVSGAVVISDAAGTSLAYFAPPWAADAEGLAVPTHYELSGATLRQVVEHQGATTYTYPIVADPLFTPTLVESVSTQYVTEGKRYNVGMTWAAISSWPSLGVNPAASLNLGMLAWRQALSRGVPNQEKYFEQFYCHWDFARWKRTYHIDTWRPNVSYWSTVRQFCNPR